MNSSTTNYHTYQPPASGQLPHRLTGEGPLLTKACRIHHENENTGWQGSRIPRNREATDQDILFVCQGSLMPLPVMINPALAMFIESLSLGIHAVSDLKTLWPYP